MVGGGEVVTAGSGNGSPVVADGADITGSVPIPRGFDGRARAAPAGGGSVCSSLMGRGRRCTDGSAPRTAEGPPGARLPIRWCPRGRVVAALLVLLTGAGAPLAFPVLHAGAATSTRPDTTPPPPEESPFSGPDDFCTSTGPPADVTLGATMPGVSTTTVDGALLLAPTEPPSASATGSHFARLVNACGGIQGRRLALHTVVATGDPATDCRAVLATGAAVVVATGSPGLDACVRSNPALVVVAPEAAAANDLLATTHGRLFVGASTEGPIDAEVEDLVSHADLASSRFAVVTAPDDSAASFRGALGLALAAHGLRPTLDLQPDLQSADPPTRREFARRLRDARITALLTDPLAPELVPLLAGMPHPPTVYAMTSPESRSRAPRVAFSAATAPEVRVESWTTPRAAAAAEGLGPSEFTTRCAEWAVAPVPGTRGTIATTTTAPDASPSASVCLAMRLLARGLFLAGPNPTQREVVRAFHNLPATDRTGPDGEPAARPNQLVNEPVRRAATVVVRTVLTTPCPASGGAPAASTTTSTVGGLALSCWVAVSGYDDGGRAVDTALTSAAQPR